MVIEDMIGMENRSMAVVPLDLQQLYAMTYLRKNIRAHLPASSFCTNFHESFTNFDCS